MNITPQQTAIANDIMAERNRQDELVAAGTLPWNCADARVIDLRKLPVLMEEVGEVAMEVYEADAGRRIHHRLCRELVQAAAVCVAWLEALGEAPTTYPAHQPNAAVIEEGRPQ